MYSDIADLFEKKKVHNFFDDVISKESSEKSGLRCYQPFSERYETGFITEYMYKLCFYRCCHPCNVTKSHWFHFNNTA